MQGLFARAALIALLSLGLAGLANANLIWNLDNVNFSLNAPPNTITNSATGYFETNAANTAIVDWDIFVTGTNGNANHHYFGGGSGESAAILTSTSFYFANFGANVYLYLFLTSPFSGSGGTIALASGSLACAGCTLLTSGSITTNAVPEPAMLGLLGVALAGIGLSRRRTR